MTTRLKMGEVQPNAYKALGALDNYVKQTSIDKIAIELIRIRASQINKCSYCVKSHTDDALKAKASLEKIQLVSVWREAPNAFTREEQIQLRMTEEITLIHKHGLEEDTYQEALEVFGVEKTAEIIMAIISINAWNRIGVSLKMEPELESVYS